jgi:hypothetical protein
MSTPAADLYRRHRFTAEEYHRMGEAGLFGEDDRVELIEGEIVEMTPIGSRDAGTVKRLIRLLSQAVGGRAIVAAQDPLPLGPRSEPEPDIALLRPRDDFYTTSHPDPDGTCCSPSKWRTPACAMTASSRSPSMRATAFPPSGWWT